jgi:hypothetical protein
MCFVTEREGSWFIGGGGEENMLGFTDSVPGSLPESESDSESDSVSLVAFDLPGSVAICDSEREAYLFSLVSNRVRVRVQ